MTRVLGVVSTGAGVAAARRHSKVTWPRRSSICAAQHSGVDAAVVAALVDRVDGDDAARSRRGERPARASPVRSTRWRRDGLRLGVVSDYPARRKLDALGIADRFDAVVSAQDERVRSFKPNPRGILVALRRPRRRPGRGAVRRGPRGRRRAGGGRGRRALRADRRAALDAQPHPECHQVRDFRQLVDLLERGDRP